MTRDGNFKTIFIVSMNLQRLLNSVCFSLNIAASGSKPAGARLETPLMFVARVHVWRTGPPTSETPVLNKFV